MTPAANAKELLDIVERQFPEYVRAGYRDAPAVTALIAENIGVFGIGEKLNPVASIDKIVEIARENPNLREVNGISLLAKYKQVVSMYDRYMDVSSEFQKTSDEFAKYFEPPGFSEGLISLDDIKPEDRTIVTKAQKSSADFQKMAERSNEMVEELKAQKKLTVLYFRGRIIELEMFDLLREIGI